MESGGREGAEGIMEVPPAAEEGSAHQGMVTHREKDVMLSIDDQEICRQRRQRLAALAAEDPSQKQHDPAQPDEIVDPDLFLVAKRGDVDKFISALEDHCAKERVSLPIVLGLRSPSMNTLLHAAAESDDTVKAVIDFVPEHLISCKNSRGETPLHIAARAGKTHAVELLLPKENPRDADCNGNSALHEAVRNRHHAVIRELVRKDPRMLYCQNKESKSPWCLAVETGDLEVVKLLLEEPSDGEDQTRSESGSDSGISTVHVKDNRRSESESNFGMSPVHVAIIYRRMDMLTEVWERKPWLFQRRDAGGGTPLHLAAYKNYLDGVKFLMEKCPRSALEQDSTSGYLPIHVACMMDHFGIVEELLQRWSDPAEFLTRLGQNIFHVSAMYGRTKTVKYILKSPNFGHIINARDFNGNTPLHLAALHCQPTVVLLARDRRVDNWLVNNSNMTALDVAEQEIEEMFPLLGKSLTYTMLLSAGTPSSEELAICKPTGRSPWKQLQPPKRELFKEKANTSAVLATLVASVAYTSGFIRPAGYNDSERNARTPTLFSGAEAYNIFVINNSIAFYSSLMAFMTLLISHVNDPFVGLIAVILSNLALLTAITAMSWAFMAGVCLTVMKHAGLSLFVIFSGMAAVYIIFGLFYLGNVSPLARRLPLAPFITDRIIYVGLHLAWKETAGSGTAGRAATSSVDNHRPNLSKDRPADSFQKDRI